MQLEGRSMREQILAAAVQLFAAYGYHAAPLRDIARMAGIQAASIYHHFPNKQALLLEIMHTSMTRLNQGLERILFDLQDPLTSFDEAISHHITLHTTYKAEFFIIDTEIRSLEPEQRPVIMALRDTYEELFQTLLRRGMEQGVFTPNDVKVTSYAIIAMCTEVATWFRPNGRLTVQQVIAIYRQFITQGLLATHECQ